jgi:hypothetical protein
LWRFSCRTPFIGSAHLTFGQCVLDKIGEKLAHRPAIFRCGSLYDRSDFRFGPEAEKRFKHRTLPLLTPTSVRRAGFLWDIRALFSLSNVPVEIFETGRRRIFEAGAAQNFKEGAAIAG